MRSVSIVASSDTPALISNALVCAHANRFAVDPMSVANKPHMVYEKAQTGLPITATVVSTGTSYEAKLLNAVDLHVFNAACKATAVRDWAIKEFNLPQPDIEKTYTVGGIEVALYRFRAIGNLNLIQVIDEIA